MRTTIAAIFLGSMLVTAAQAQQAPQASGIQGAIQGMLGGNQRNQDETARRAYERGRQDQAAREHQNQSYHHDHYDAQDRGQGPAYNGYGPGPAVGGPPPPYYGH